MGEPVLNPLTDAMIADETVVKRVLAGEAPLFELLMRRHNERIYRVTRAILQDDAEAEDAMQQAYISAFNHLGQFQGTARFSTWLTRIAIREATARVRKRTALHLVDTDMEQRVGAGPSPEDTLATKELCAVVESVVEALPEAHRVVFMMRVVEEMNVEETASCLGISEELVKVRLHRARAQVRDTVHRRLGKELKAAFAFPRTRCDRVVAAVFQALARAGLAR